MLQLIKVRIETKQPLTLAMHFFKLERGKLRLSPFFIPSRRSQQDNPKLEKTSKLVTTTLLVQRRGEAEPSYRRQARKDKQAKMVLRTSFHHFCLLVWGKARRSRAVVLKACLSMGYFV